MADDADKAAASGDIYLDTALKNRQRMAERAASEPGTEFCEDCGHRIPDRRREKMPHARTCVPCQTLREQRGE